MAQLVEQLIRNEQVASSSLAIGFFILSKLSSADSHYNFCRLTKIVSSANKFAYGYVSSGFLPSRTYPVESRYRLFYFAQITICRLSLQFLSFVYCKPKKNCLLNSAPFSLYSLLALSPASLAFTSR